MELIQLLWRRQRCHGRRCDGRWPAPPVCVVDARLFFFAGLWLSLSLEREISTPSFWIFRHKIQDLSLPPFRQDLPLPSYFPRQATRNSIHHPNPSKQKLLPWYLTSSKTSSSSIVIMLERSLQRYLSLSSPQHQISNCSQWTKYNNGHTISRVVLSLEVILVRSVFRMNTSST